MGVEIKCKCGAEFKADNVNTDVFFIETEAVDIKALASEFIKQHNCNDGACKNSVVEGN